jgi:aminoglycoside 6'-N-acetyltransferase I
MIIRPVQASDAAEWLRLRMALWPDSDSSKQSSEIAHFLAVPPRAVLPALHAAFVCERDEGGLCGLAEASLRSYADGCETSPAGYLEAWYVDPDVRQQGVGRALVAAAEAWVRRQGCREMASDADLDNTISQAAHVRLGYRETGRAVQFCKALDTFPAASADDDLSAAIDALLQEAYPPHEPGAMLIGAR